MFLGDCSYRDRSVPSVPTKWNNLRLMERCGLGSFTLLTNHELL